LDNFSASVGGGSIADAVPLRTAHRSRSRRSLFAGILMLVLSNESCHEAPDRRHFCFLKTVRVASSLNASIVPQQGKPHAVLGKSLDDFAEQYREIEGRAQARILYSKIYRTYSNYVHAKYPECMDLFEGRPGHFHFDGMSGAPTNTENAEMIEAGITTASLAFVAMIQGLNLIATVNADPVIANWYGNHFTE
jgi:hypothetical protein